MYTLGSLFTGIGGIDLAFQRAGFQIAFQVEIDDYCNRVLERHWPHVERRRDVRECSAGNLPAVDVLAGGFPCQDISDAGQKAGIKGGKRSVLWYEYARLIGDLRPRYVFIENVAAIVTRDGQIVLNSLTSLGYDAEWGVIPASAVGAPHRRARWFCVAYTRYRGRESGEWRGFSAATIGEIPHNGPTDGDPALAHTDSSWGSQSQRVVSKFRGRTEHSSETMGNPTSERLSQSGQSKLSSMEAQNSTGLVIQSERSSSDVVNPDSAYPKSGYDAESALLPNNTSGLKGSRNALPNTIDRTTESVLGRAINGLSRQLDGTRWPAAPGQEQHRWEASRTITQKLTHRPARVKALGNAVVPQVVQPIAEAIRSVLEEADRGTGSQESA